MLDRRTLLRALAVPPLATAAGCLGGSHGKIVLRFWNGFTGPDGRTMLKMVRRFNATHPGIEVVMQRIDWATYWNKLFVAGLGGRAPEVFVLHTRSLVRFAKAGFTAPLDPFLADFPVGDMDANVLEAARVGDRQMGLPLDVHAMGMYVNRRLFRDAGLDPDRPPTDRETFVDAMRRMRRPAANGEPDRWGFVFTNFETCTYTFLRQFGGALFAADSDVPTFDRPENIDALAWCRSLIANGLAPEPENFDSWIGFRQGRVGMAFEGIYMLADLLKQQDLDFSGAPVPQVGSAQAVWADSHNLCIRAGLSDDIARAAWTFIRWLSEESLDWAEGGQVPTRPSLRDTARFRAMAVQSAFARQIPIVRYLPQLPFVFEYLTEYDLAVEKVLRGKSTPAEALGSAQARVEQVRNRESAPPGSRA
ncbi:MAG: ABC transporter substrate-binding protein [Armatimonadota bacterium]